MAKETKTRAELVHKIMERLAHFPECANITGIGITRPLGRSWDVAIARSGAQIQVRCRERADEILTELAARYDLAAED
jgi:hypothetical protein